MASLYLDESLPTDAFREGERIRLSGEDARHATRVARVRPGETIAIGDGAGTIARGSVVSIDDAEVVVLVEQARREAPPVPELWLAQALAKGDRDERAVQAATELGVHGVIPWAAARSVARWSPEKTARGRQRWAAIAREAAKQSIRARVPLVAELAGAADLTRVPGQLVVLDPEAAEPVSALEFAGAWRITLVVGPEGGIAPEELGAFVAAGAGVARLGPEVLRTSTAGPAAIAALRVRLGHW